MGGKNETSLQAHHHFIRSEIEAADMKVKQKLQKTTQFNQTCIELSRAHWYDIPSVKGEKMIVLLEKEIRSLQPVEQGETIKPVPDEAMAVLSIMGNWEILVLCLLFGKF